MKRRFGRLEISRWQEIKSCALAFGYGLLCLIGIYYFVSLLVYFAFRLVGAK